MKIVWRWHERRRRSRRGFTLLEVIVALAILAMSILFITRAFLILLQQTTKGGNLTVASALAVRRLEQIRSSTESQSTSSGWQTNFNNINPEGPTAFPAPYNNYIYTVTVNQVNFTPAQPSWLTGAPLHPNSTKWITVTVTYQGTPLARVTSAVIGDMYR